MARLGADLKRLKELYQHVRDFGAVSEALRSGSGAGQSSLTAQTTVPQKMAQALRELSESALTEEGAAADLQVRTSHVKMYGNWFHFAHSMDKQNCAAR